MRLTRTRMSRLTAAAVLVVTAIAVPLSAVRAAPSKEEVDNAIARAEQLAHEYENAAEAYNDAVYRLQQVEADLDEAKTRMDEAASQADSARQALSDRAVETYTAMGSQLDVLLEAEDFSQFSDRLTFMGAIAESDADVAAQADAAGQKAEWAADAYKDKLEEQRALVARAKELEATAKSKLAEQQAIADRYQAEYQAWVQAQAEAARQAAASTVPPGGGGNDPVYNPPPVSGAAGVAVSAAYGALGSPYVWGSAGPSTFDCSGLTSYAWAQAGRSIPHSASAQWSSLPRVSLSDVQAGDIIYYGNFGPHVALYVGGGRIIHARHPGPGGEVQIDSMYGYDRPWGAVRVA